MRDWQDVQTKDSSGVSLILQAGQKRGRKKSKI